VKYLIAVLLLFLFSACTNKTEVITKSTFVCVELLKVELSNEVKIRVYKSDLALFIARKEELKTAISFYENQIDRYNLLCKEMTDENIK